MELGKVRITFFVAISGSVGYVIANGGGDLTMLLVALGIFVLSSGSAAFNHIQEIKTDALMNRTKNRPLPTNKISKTNASVVAILMSLAGLFIIYSASNFEAFVFGILAFISYNVIYTPLKRLTAWAIMPGGLVGAIPPVIGWAAAGGDLLSPQLLALAMFFFVWQIPHFWFLLLLYDKDYRKAGFPTLTSTFSNLQLRRISYVWVVALAATCMLLPLFGATHNTLTSLLLLLAGFVLVYRTGKLISTYQPNMNLKFAFRDINLYVLTVVILLSVDQFVVIY